MNLTKTSLASLALTAAMGTLGIAQAEDNPFAMQDLKGGYQLAAADEGTMAGKAKDSKCGAGKATETKSTEGKCGGDKGKAAEGKCGGAKETEAKTMEGKCGGSKK